MAREFSRTQRVAEQLRRDLAQLIQQEVKDPRLGLVTVNDVKISKDLSYADVYVTVMGKEESQAQIDTTLKILNRAAGFLRGRLAKAIKLRVMPQLRFHYDASVVRGNYLSSLIDKAVSEDRSRQGDSEED
ncbi:30S ribosome-binding factor RbfA [Motiliproteus sp. SC1-56]|uniref:30S ribosome-binding factor RbfA n=1 Tax=Motiliproteus sp. SC1-56 TaxID=2799565 RepID=UPI001A8C7B40|nr:30S ribosome-binding factor RbfA [Motiliproteus sp. SC1-56]